MNKILAFVDEERIEVFKVRQADELRSVCLNRVGVDAVIDLGEVPFHIPFVGYGQYIAGGVDRSCPAHAKVGAWGVLGWGRGGVLAFWRVGVLACWGFGVLACWRVGVLACWGFGVLGFWPHSAKASRGRRCGGVGHGVRGKVLLDGALFNFDKRVRGDALFLQVGQRAAAEVFPVAVHRLVDDQ